MGKEKEESRVHAGAKTYRRQDAETEPPYDVLNPDLCFI